MIKSTVDRQKRDVDSCIKEHTRNIKSYPRVKSGGTGCEQGHRMEEIKISEF